ncbi:hypothetical protein DZS_28310 [Dickeya ananatis]
MQRIRELAVQAANDTNGTNDRSAIQTEINRRVDEINRVANSANFNGKKTAGRFCYRYWFQHSGWCRHHN